LKGVLVEYWYFTINYLLPSPHNELWNPVYSKEVVLRAKLKEFFMKCLEQFTMYRF
jgi:hypothetical protein